MRNVLKQIKNLIRLELLIVKKVRGKMYFLDLGGFESRNNSMKVLLSEALKDCKDFKSIIVNTGDRPINKHLKKLNILSFATSSGYFDEVIPDFIYDSRKEVNIFDFIETVEEMKKAGERPGFKKQIGRIGNFKTSLSRQKLADLGKKYPKYFDIQDSSNPSTKWLSLHDLVKKYDCLIDVEGRGYSGRTKLLFFSGRPLFIQERQWIDYCLKYATPYEDYIPIKNDFSDLVEKFSDYLDNPDKYYNVGNNGKNFAELKLSKDSAKKEIFRIFNDLKFSSFNFIYVRVFVAVKMVLKVCSLFYLIINKIWREVMKL